MSEFVELIVPCHNEQENVERFYKEFKSAFEKCPIRWGLIMVDDGSSDDTYSELKKLALQDASVRVIRFSRNFGKEAAILAGLQASTGNYVGIIDGDLQQPPSVALEMLEELLADPRYDCVAAYQEHRKEGKLVSALKKRFYLVFAKASHAQVVADASDFRIFKRVVADAILQLPEYYRFSKGIFAWIGFETKPFPYTPAGREAGESKWSLRSLFAYAFEGLLSFTTSPLHFITKFGLAVCLIAVVYAIALIARTLVMGIDLPGYASTVALILLLGGGQFFAIGVIGEYLARTYIQGKNRPVFIVKETDNFDNPHGDARPSGGVDIKANSHE